MSDDCQQQKCPEGTPAWVMTFSDLMSLLLSFFVLLFSFSEMDVEKYKQVAGSMKEAFGVQRQVKVKDPPKGINVIARNFSPGKTKPTPFNQVKQSTADDYHQYPVLGESPSIPSQEAREIKKESEKIRLALEKEIEQGLIEVETRGRKIIIRIREKGSFPSGSAQMIRPFRKVIKKMVKALKQATAGKIVVAGHTDNVPIHNGRFRSNWELSASRAVTVIEELLKSGKFDKKRFKIAAFGDTKPIAPNTTSKGRAKNRRVEVTLVYGRDKEKKPDSAKNQEKNDG